MTQTDQDLQLDVIQLKKAAMVLRAVNHKLRQQIVKLIHENQKMTVTEIYMAFKLDQSAASQHLAILRRSGFVFANREGKFIYYSINYSRFSQVKALSYAIVNLN
jgi:DNA-binding transcriptional ArsR family regulator